MGTMQAFHCVTIIRTLLFLLSRVKNPDTTSIKTHSTYAGYLQLFRPWSILPT
jgi:hypothetical protein